MGTSMQYAVILYTLYLFDSKFIIMYKFIIMNQKSNQIPVDQFVFMGGRRMKWLQLN